ncbi:MAG: hypothetical protein KDB75_03770 [Flavobacteriales bacterium]|nr:hypothetical protein [Flavobacteriales bacterium]MCB0788397.1 hypothetical protein [Flavobacteriales bacterium]
MKRVLFSGLIMMSSLQLAAQSWAPVGATWTYEQRFFGGPDSALLVMSVVKDTVVQGRASQKLNIVQGWVDCYPFYPIISYDGDSLLLYDEADSTFKLMYCFNAEPGDTWTSFIHHGELTFFSDSITWTVLDTSSTLLGGEVLRTLTLEVVSDNLMLVPYCWPVCVAIEKVGAMNYLFDFPIGICDNEVVRSLRCYSDSTITWQNPDVPQCALGTSVPELNAQAFRVAPTLLDRGEALTVDLGDRLDAEGLTIRLTDLSGRMVREAPIAGTRTTLQVDASGAFLVVLLKNGRPIGRQRVVVR